MGYGLGPRIREARKRIRLSLVQVAERTGLSVSYLSQVERDLLTPSVSSLKRIADALDMPAGEFMFDQDGVSATAGAVVVRVGRRKTILFPGSNIHYELLTPDLRRRNSMLWLNAPPGSESGEPFAHEGEDSVLLLEGSLEVEVAGMWYTLHPGDNIYFDARLPHRWRNQTDSPAQAIWVSSPPSF